MRTCRMYACAALLLAGFAFAQQPPTKAKAAPEKPPARSSAEQALKNILEPKVTAEWEAFKNKDTKALGELLAPDFIGVETDRQGTRTREQAMREVTAGNIYKYTLFGFGVIPLGPDAAFVTYESTEEFNPKAQVRFLRVYISELWLKRGGEWKMRHYQETAVR